MATKRTGSVQSLSYILRHETYGELTFGSPVRISGERGIWAFRHHCTNLETGSEWLDVFGGLPGAETLRAFALDRVTLIRAKGTRKPKLRLEDLI